MQIGDLVQWKGLNGHGRAWAGVGVVIDYNYHPKAPNEALVLWNNGSSAWYFERRLITINNGGCHEQSD